MGIKRVSVIPNRGEGPSYERRHQPILIHPSSKRECEAREGTAPSQIPSPSPIKSYLGMKIIYLIGEQNS
jgi:hypothetical protein